MQTDKMNLERINYLYEQYHKSSLTKEESQEWDALSIDPEFDKLFSDLVDGLWNRDDLNTPAMKKDDAVAIVDSILTKPQLNPISKRLSYWPRIAAVAAVLLIAGLGLFFYGQKSNDKAQVVVAKNDILPGKEGATLTLANGRKIRLSAAVDGELAREAGVVIKKSTDGQIVYDVKGSSLPTRGISPQGGERGATNTLTTAKGETYQVRLPDGSLVWLNAASSLTYSAILNERGLRRVKLEGEAYFEVAKDKAHPFVVQSGGQEVEVLGTHFNIKAYPDDKLATTTLVEGRVRVSALLRSEHEIMKVLKPNQESVFSNNQFIVNQTNALKAIAWKQGYFSFQNEKIRNIMQQLIRWYDIEVKYEGEVTEEGLYGKISRNKPISEVLKMLEETGLVRFKIEERRVTVLK